MTTYRYPGLPAVDPSTNQVVRNQVGQLFDVADANRGTPLSFRSLSGVAASTLTVGPLGVTDQFEIDDYPKVLWKSGQYELVLWSPDSLVNAAVAAVGSAAASAAAAQAAQQAAESVQTGAGGGVTDHGALSGLGDDDHPQYLTPTRGDSRYYTQTVADQKTAAAVAATSAADRDRANHTGTQSIGSVTSLTAALAAKADLVDGQALLQQSPAGYILSVPYATAYAAPSRASVVGSRADFRVFVYGQRETDPDVPWLNDPLDESSIGPA